MAQMMTVTRNVSQFCHSCILFSYPGIVNFSLFEFDWSYPFHFHMRIQHILIHKDAQKETEVQSEKQMCVHTHTHLCAHTHKHLCAHTDSDKLIH